MCGWTLLVAGYYGYGNLGDEAIRAALQAALARRPELRALWLVARPQGRDEVRRRSPIRVFSTLARSRALLLGGGGLLQNATSVRSLAYYLGLVLAARFLRRPVFLLGQGIGPIAGRAARRLTRFALSRAAFLGCRDERSLALLRELGLAGSLGGDLFFLDPPAGTPPPRESGAPRILFCLKGTRATGATVDRFVALLRAVRTVRPDVSLGLLPFFPAEDLPLARAIAGRLGPRCAVVQAGSVVEALTAIAGADLVVSSRLHPLEFALAVRTPVHAIPVDPKISGFLEELRALGGPALPCEPFPSAESILRVLDAPPDREALRAATARMHERTTEALTSFFRSLDQVLGGKNG